MVSSAAGTYSAFSSMTLDCWALQDASLCFVALPQTHLLHQSSFPKINGHISFKTPSPTMYSANDSYYCIQLTQLALGDSISHLHIGPDVLFNSDLYTSG